MSKHTPGPWSLSDETLRDGLRSKLLYGRPEGMLAIVRTEHQGAYYGDANARLIATAPELLAALKEICGPITVAGPPDVIGACQDLHQLICNIALPIIAKAEDVSGGGGSA